MNQDNRKTYFSGGFFPHSPMPQESVTHWIDDLKAGDHDAAQQVWERYFDKLVHVGRKKLGKFPRRSSDEEDVALSAFNSFCKKAAAGQFPKLDDRNDLWKILFTITERKAIAQIKKTCSYLGHVSILRRDASEPHVTLFKEPAVGQDGSWSICLSPDGTYLAAAGNTGELKLWDTTTGEGKVTFEGPKSRVEGLDYHPKASLLASTRESEVVLWNTETGSEEYVFDELPATAWSVAFHPAGQLLAASLDNGEVMVWDIASRQVLFARQCHAQRVSQVTYSPDGTRMATSGHDGLVKLWDVETGEAVLSLRTDSPWIHDVAFSPDGTTLVAANNSGTITVWDTNPNRAESLGSRLASEFESNW